MSRSRRMVRWAGPSIAVGLLVGAAAGAAFATVPDAPAPLVRAGAPATTSTQITVLNPEVDSNRPVHVVGSVAAAGQRPTGRVELWVDGERADVEPLTVGVATLRAEIDVLGRHRVQLRYTGSSVSERSISRTVTVVVV